MDYKIILGTIAVLIILVLVLMVPWRRIINSFNVGAATTGKNTALMVGAGILAAVAAVAVWWYWDTITNTSFGWRFIIAGFAVIVAWRLTKAKKLNWATSLLGLLLVLFFVNILASNVGKGAAGKLTSAEAGVATGSLSFGSSCPDKNQEAKVGMTYEAVRGCGTLRLTGLLPEGVTYEVVEGAFSDKLEDHLNIRWQYPTIRTFTLPDTVPAKTEKIVFRIVSPEESAEIDKAADTARMAETDKATEAAGANVMFGTYATK